MTTIRIASTPMIYSIGLFDWIEKAILPFDADQAQKLLRALGIPLDCIKSIVNGDYAKSNDGETLILKIK